MAGVEGKKIGVEAQFLAAPPPGNCLALDYRSPSCDKVPDQRDDCQHQQKVNEPDSHVEGHKAQNPRDEQDYR
jgi:hypothetical protein